MGNNCVIPDCEYVAGDCAQNREFTPKHQHRLLRIPARPQLDDSSPSMILELPTAGFSGRRPQSSRRRARRSMKAVVWCIVAAQRLSRGRMRCCIVPTAVRAEDVDQMDRDLYRTNLCEPIQTARVRTLLLRQIAEDPQLGYCQGMNLVATVFSAAAGTYEEAYSRFHRFVDRMRGLWLPGFPLLQVGELQFVSVAKDRPWYRHLLAHNVDPSMFLPQALLTMFTMWLPLDTVVHCLELPEKRGLEAMVAITVAVLDHAKDRFLQQRGLEGIMQVLQDLPTFAPPPSKLALTASATLPVLSDSMCPL